MRDVGRQEIFFFCSNEFGFGRLSADAHHPCEVLTSLTLCSANPAMHALPSFLLQTDLSMAAAAQLSHPGSRSVHRSCTNLASSFLHKSSNS